MDAEEIIILPNFLAEGYYTKKVIPEKLNLAELPSSVKYLKPLGLHPMIQDIILDTASRAMGDWKQEETSLILLGHGSTKSATSKDTLLDHISHLKEKNQLCSDHRPLARRASIYQGTGEMQPTAKNILFIPYLIADGQHGGWDLPELIGVERDIYDAYKAHPVDDYQIKLTPALGKSAMMVELINLLTQEHS